MSLKYTYEVAYMQYMRNVTDYMSHHPTQRRGQAHFNVLYVMYPHIANQVRGCEIDPFMDDTLLPYFMDFVYDALRRMEEEGVR